MNLTHIDLFSGIGGFTLAAQRTGFETVVFCEKDEFCQKVLQKRFGAIIADSKSMGWRNGIAQNKGKKPRKIDSFSNETPLLIPEIRDFDGTKWKGAALLTGGFPCQPFSVAGQRRGKEDDRYLWPEMLRVISEAKPRWILAENVPGIFRMALDTVLAGLEGEGYTTGTLIIPACGLNAPHRRNRVWIIANSKCSRFNGKKIYISKRKSQQAFSLSSWTNSQFANPTEQGLERSIGKVKQGHRRRFAPQDRRQDWQEDWHEVATRFCRMDDGISNRVDRLKALGNAIVPQIAEVIMRNIKTIEEELNHKIL